MDSYPTRSLRDTPSQTRFFGNFETFAKLGSATAPVSNWATNVPGAETVIAHLLSVDGRHDLPAIERETLADWFEERGGAHVLREEADRTAVLYPDVYTNGVQVEHGKAAVRVLESLGVAVTIPDVAGSGRALLSQSMIATAE